MKYRKKPVVIEAMQLVFEDTENIKKWVGGGRYYSTPPMRAVTGIQFAINLVALYGEWIVKDEDGTFSVVDPITFEKTYSLESDSPTQQEGEDEMWEDVWETFMNDRFIHTLPIVKSKYTIQRKPQPLPAASSDAIDDAIASTEWKRDYLTDK